LCFECSGLGAVVNGPRVPRPLLATSGHSDTADGPSGRSTAESQKRKLKHDCYTMCHGGGEAMESLGVFLGGVGVFFIGVAALWWVSKK